MMPQDGQPGVVDPGGGGADRGLELIGCLSTNATGIVVCVDATPGRQGVLWLCVSGSVSMDQSGVQRPALSKVVG
jgi:hypothetical protein